MQLKSILVGSNFLSHKTGISGKILHLFAPFVALCPIYNTLRLGDACVRSGLERGEPRNGEIGGAGLRAGGGDIWKHFICIFVFVYLSLCICLCVFVFVYLYLCIRLCISFFYQSLTHSAGLSGGGGDIWKITRYSRPWGLDKVSAKTIQVQKATLSGQGEAFNQINIFFSHWCDIFSV